MHGVRAELMASDGHMGIEIAKPYLNQHTIRHYKDRASEIEKELKENGRG